VKKFVLLCTTAMLPSAVFAQSTGTVEFEKSTIVITGKKSTDVGGVQIPDATKAKQVVTQELISRSAPGQTVLDVINVVPGVSFQNNDAYGLAGGTITMRGFDSTRISYTLDGIQLNDSGNYNIYSNFSIDPELIEQVNVNLGSTDVDSPTASAVGGTINQRTRIPGVKPGVMVNASLGQYDYRRLFAMVDTGAFGPWGTRAFIAGSAAAYDNPFNNYGRMKRQQYNARLYQPIGNNGDFISLAGRYNQDRNNFFGSVGLRNDLPVTAGFPQSRSDRKYGVVKCTLAPAVAGVADKTNSCGTEFDRRYNPSNSINIRANSKLTLMDGLVLTVDPSYQYTKANGGGTTTGNEAPFDLNPTGGRANCLTTADGPDVTCETGYFGGRPYVGKDLNGDGDLLDQVTVLAPSQTRTRRYAVVAGLAYEFMPHQLARLTFTHDYSNHRQTGQVGFLKPNGEPIDVFPVNDPLVAASGKVLQKRDRQSYAILNKIAGEYRGDFGPLTVDVGLALPYFKRDLENFCFASSATGFVECSGQDPAIDAELAAFNPYVVDPATGKVISGWSPPGHRVLNYHKLLPSAGLVYDFTPSLSGFASYTKNLSVPSTDNLYNAFYFPAGTEQAKPKPETTDSFDGGVRYRSRQIQAQLSMWYTRFDNRLASAYDPELDRTVYRNLGRVNKWGIDGDISYEPIPQLTLYAFGSVNRSKIRDNVQLGKNIADCDTVTDPTTVTAIQSCAFTAGNYESGAPKYMYGFSGVGRMGIFELGVTAKRTGPRYVFDTNVPVFKGPIATPTEVFSATAPAYWLVNLDARMKLSMIKGLEKSYLQFNVYNLFDQVYVGGFGGGLNQSLSGSNYGSPPFVQIGAPRTVMGTLHINF
jgi:iron complex outermembrane receptor protein